MKIITISREFGSGGREVGKRLADELGFDYYDKEIISAIADQTGMDPGYVSRVLDTHGWQQITLNFQTSFTGIAMQTPQTSLMIAQKKIIEEIAKTGKDCVIVGRNADVLLEDYHPLNIFVCADMDAKLKRCRERASKDINLSDKEMIQKIKRIDKNRSKSREIITDKKWGERSSYHLTINTTGWNLKELVPVIATFAESFFEKHKN